MRQFRLPYDLIVFDLEANQPSSKVIEIGAVKLLRDGGIHPNRFSQLVKIDESLGKCQTREGEKTITELTGISQEILDKDGVDFPEALKRFNEWAKSETKNVLLASWGAWDAPCLRDNCEYNKVEYPFRGKSLDIKNVGIWMNLITGKKVKSDGLGSMMRGWNLKFEGDKHRACDDAYNTARLIQSWWNFYRDQGDRILTALKHLGIYNK